MDQEGPRTKSLHEVRQSLKKLEREYPADATDSLRARYFAIALRHGIAIHKTYGLSKQECLEMIGLTIGVSADQLEKWMRLRAAVHVQFHSDALMTQTALMDDHIHACAKILATVKLNLDADDWRAELSAFPHLWEISAACLRRYGGPESSELLRQVEELIDGQVEQATLENRRLVLTLIAEELDSIIGKEHVDSVTTKTAESETIEQHPTGSWVN